MDERETMGMVTALEAAAVEIDSQWRARGGLDCTEVCAIIRSTDAALTIPDAKPVCWQVKLVADSSWLDIPEHRVEEFRRDAHEVRPLYASPANQSIRELEEEVKRLREALDTIATSFHGSNPSMAYADAPREDYLEHVLMEARRFARSALYPQGQGEGS